MLYFELLTALLNKPQINFQKTAEDLPSELDSTKK